MNIENYGFLFNDIRIVGDIFEKRSKNEYGKKKIAHEINFYSNIIKKQISLKIPNIYVLDLLNSTIKMKYYKNSKPLTDCFYNSIEDIPHIITQILDDISILHNFFIIPVSKIEYMENLNIEIRYKIISRFQETNWVNIPQFNTIKSVNGIPIYNMSYYIDRISKEINNLNLDYNLCYIHGDIHLGNILINNEEKQLYFIDPRGYFGSHELLGIKEYDYAKLLFGISGYSVFDNMGIDKLNIVDGNIEIHFINEYHQIFESQLFNKFTKLLALSIWLGNNNTFKNENKKLTSLMIAYYLCEKYLV
jgi:hypothetical protein